MNTLRLLLNIFKDDTSIYGWSSKNQDNQSVSADLFTEQGRIGHWGSKWLVNFNTPKTELVTFSSNSSSHNESLNTPLDSLTWISIATEVQPRYQLL